MASRRSSQLSYSRAPHRVHPRYRGRYIQTMADPRTERRPRTPLAPREEGGPPVPGPGAPQRAPRMPGSRRFWMVVVIALVINYATVALFASGKEHSVTIPYSPAFLEQVQNGNVKRVAT